MHIYFDINIYSSLHTFPNTQQILIVNRGCVVSHAIVQDLEAALSSALPGTHDLEPVGCHSDLNRYALTWR